MVKLIRFSFIVLMLTIMSFALIFFGSYISFNTTKDVPDHYHLMANCKPNEESTTITTDSYGDILKICGERNLEYDDQGLVKYVFNGILDYNQIFLDKVSLIHIRADPVNYYHEDGIVQRRLPNYYYFDDSIRQELSPLSEIKFKTDAFNYSELYTEGWNSAYMSMRLEVSFFGNQTNNHEIGFQKTFANIFKYYLMQDQYVDGDEGYKFNPKMLDWSDILFATQSKLKNYLHSNQFFLTLAGVSVVLIRDRVKNKTSPNLDKINQKLMKFESYHIKQKIENKINCTKKKSRSNKKHEFENNLLDYFDLE